MGQVEIIGSEQIKDNTITEPKMYILSEPTEGDVLYWDGSDLDYFPLVPSGVLTEGSVIFAGSDGRLVEDNANFFWDDTNKILELNADVNISGDLTFVDTGGLHFGSCYGNHIGWSQAVAVQNTWYNIIDADMITGNLKGITHDGNGKLTVTEPGMYKVSYNITFETNAANIHIDTGIEVTGSGSADAQGIAHIETKFANQEHFLSGPCAILELADNATLEVAIRTLDVGTPTIAVQNVSLSTFQLGGT